MRRHTSSAQPVQIAKQAVESARNAAANVDVAEVRDALTAQAARAAEAAQSVDLSAVKDNVTSEMSKDYDLVISETRKRPLRSLLIAVGLGAAVGAIVDRISRRRAEQQKKQQQTQTTSGMR